MTRITSFDEAHRFLSNFYPAPMVYDGIRYPTAEHTYQAAKTLDRDMRAFIARLTSPGQAKRQGRKVTIRPHWDEDKLSVMYWVVKRKFEQNPELLALLAATGEVVLEEGNRWGDRYWGISPPNSGEGLNHLGRILMKVREELRNG